MISAANMEYVRAAAKSYDRMVGKTYLIVYGAGQKQPPNFAEVQITERNFWHLVGCKFSEAAGLTKEQKADLYAVCLDGTDISRTVLKTAARIF